jgi:general secretion pathway protein L
MSPTRLILIPTDASDPAPFMTVAANGAVLQRGTMTLDPAERPVAMRTVAVVPGTEVLIRWMALPVGSDAQVRVAALWGLREQIAVAPDRVSLALGEAAGGERMVCVVNTGLLQVWIDYLEALQVTADVLTPDVLTIPAPAGDELAAVRFQSNVALRGARLAATVQPDMVDLIAAGRSVLPIESDDAIERLMIEAALRPAINLIDRRPGLGKRGWRRALALAAAVVLSPLVLTLASAAHDDLTARQLNSQTRKALEQAAPDIAASADPEAELTRRLGLASAAGGAGSVAAALFSAVESVEGAELDGFAIDPETGVRATLTYPAYQDLDAMKAAMTRAGLTLTDDSTVEDGGRVVSEVRIGAGA